MSETDTEKCEDGKTRCFWGNGDKQYQHYHDFEWGRPVIDDYFLFEKICLEGFQSGLSWLTILRKRENFRKAFVNFDFNKVANYTENDVLQLLQDAGIVRHRKKIEATINNARRATELVEEFGSLASYIWQWEPKNREPHSAKGEYKNSIPSITKTSEALSKDLKNRGWKFFGPTTAYAFMQAMGLVNDHVEGCFCYDVVGKLREDFVRP